MYRAIVMIVALTVVPSVAAAQQPCTADANQVVNELYRHMLERNADSGSSHWVQQLQSGRATVRDVVREIAKSQEHTQRFWRTESGEESPYFRAVGTLYRHLLGRQPDAAGARSWAEQGAQQGVGYIVDRITASNEYTNQFGDWGVPGSGGLRYCGPNNQGAHTRTPPVSDDNVRGRRWGRMDTNDDGVITLREWRGNRRAFEVRDRNNDGVLSGNEIDDRGVAATSGELIVVDPTRAWTDTGIDVRAGEMIMFDAEGTVRLSDDANDAADPGGSYTGRRATNAPLRRAAAGGLIARIGAESITFIGDRRSLRAPASGRLYLGVNDDHLPDNSGEFRVTVDVRAR